MARFTAATSGTPPSQVLTITDNASPGFTLATMPLASLSAASGSTATWTAPTVTIESVDRAFGTPYGEEREMGLNFHFDFDNSGSVLPADFGKLNLDKFLLGTPISVIDTQLPLAPLSLTSTNFRSRNYPLGNYSPLVIIRGASNYNLCAALAYPILEYDHPCYVEYGIYDSPATTNFFFEASYHPGAGIPPIYFDIPAGAKRRYTLMLRLNDRTNTNIGPAPDAAQEWLWTLRGYQQYFRERFGRPNYRRMNGRDGRAVGSFNTSALATGPNPRGFNPENPTTTGGSPAGYYKFTARAAVAKSRNVPRYVIWALSGHHTDTAQYDFRFATQVATNVGDAPGTIRDAMRTIRGNMRLGLWWGQSTTVFAVPPPTPPDFFVTTRHPFDPDDSADVSAAFAEADLAVYDWRAQFIGLDQYDLLTRSPRKAWNWFKTLQQRYPRVVFSPEASAPDFMHTLGPTYSTIETVSDLVGPFWIQQYLNPGAELLLQINNYVNAPADDAAIISNAGFVPLADWQVALDGALNASLRWRELGEHAIPNSTVGFPVRNPPLPYLAS